MSQMVRRTVVATGNRGHERHMLVLDIENNRECFNPSAFVWSCYAVLQLQHDSTSEVTLFVSFSFCPWLCRSSVRLPHGLSVLVGSLL